MNRIRIAIAALGALGILACLDREYRNPFLADGESEIGDEWKRDHNGNGIADSVEFYLGHCESTPAECLQRAREASIIANSQRDSVGAQDTAKPDIPPKDTIRDTVIVAPPAVAVTGIEASSIYIPMGVPKATPSVRVLPRDAKNQGYALFSLDEAIVKVSGMDLVPVKAGTAKVRARSDEGGFTVEFTATVVIEDTNIYETAVTVAPMELTAGDPPLAPDIAWIPANVTQRAYSLSSSNPASVKVVSEGGMESCLPLAAGNAIVSLTTLGKGLTATFEVKVKPAPILSFPVLSIAAEDMILELDGPNQIPAVTYTPSFATDKGYRLASEEPDIVSVSGMALRPMAKGKATITITSVDGPSSTFTATVRVRVAAVSAPDLTLANGGKAVPEVNILPADADDQMYSLASEDESIVAIEGTEISARKRGKAVVSIVTRDGSKTGSFTVTVKNKGWNGDEEDGEDEEEGGDDD